MKVFLLLLLCWPLLSVGQGSGQIWGVNIHFTDAEAGEMAQIANGYRIARMDFQWAAIEKQKGVYDFSAYDRLLQQQESAKVRAYWILDYSNALYDGGLSPHTDEGREAFSNWTVAAVTHFQGHNIIWEMWNEPNIGFWTPTPNVDDYSALANAVGAALDNAGLHSEIYVGPAAAGLDLNFIEGTFKAGLLKYWDAVSFHPYRTGHPETALADYEKLANLIKQYNPNKPQSIFSGEWGWTTCGPCNPDYGNQVALTTQGKFLARQWLTNTLAGVPVSIYYDWKDDGTDQTAPESRFGTVEQAYHNSTLPHTPKPAYVAASALQAALPPTLYSYRTRIDAVVGGTVNTNAYVLSFSKSGSTTTTAYAVWKTDASQTCANIASANRTDCGFDGISEDDCHVRECCFETPYVGPGPQCYFQETSASLSFSASSSGATCFKVVDYLGTSVSDSLCPQNGQITVTASDGPLYLVA